ncbi:MAG: class I SAM-dependent methyltransferase [Pseudomonadota bacterium]
MAATSAEFWDRVADRYSKRAIADPETYERKLHSTQALMRPEMKILEFGCGTGSTALLHAPHVAHVDATDVSAAMVDIGRDKALRAGINNVEFLQAGVDDFSAPEGSYDMVLALNLLHLLPDHGAALAKCHRLLKPGGFFVSTTPCLSDRMWYLRPVIPLMRWVGMAPPVSFLKASGLEKEITAAGFETQEQWTHGSTNSLFLVARKIS